MTTSASEIKGWQRVLMIIIPYIFFVGIFQVIGLTATGVDLKSFDAPRDTIQNLIISVFSLIGTVLVVWFFKRKVDNESFWNIGLQIKGKGSDIIYGSVFGFLIMGLGFLILLFLGEIRIIAFKFNFNELLLSLLFFSCVALSEEIIMRGYVLNNLLKSFNKYIALIISSVIFSAGHLANPSFSWLSFLTITIAGLLLGLSYIYTKNIWFPIALHFSWNFFQGTIFGFNVSGQTTYVLIEQHRLSDTILNGGKFGFEGSVLSIGLQLICLVIVWKIFHKKLNTNNIS